MRPAQQRLHPGDEPVGAAHDGLVGDLELVLGERRAQVPLQAVAVVGLECLAQVDDLVAGAALALGLVHRQVGLDHQLVGDVLTRAGERHADAGRDRELGAGQHERCGERIVDAAGEDLDVGRAVQVLAQEHELVPGHPGQGVARPDQTREPVRDGEQQLVADLMAVGVVDLLEPVEVGEQDRGVGVRALGALGGVLESLLQQQPVRQPGQRVVQRDVAEAVGGRAASSRAWALSR